jgi:chemotaxis protein CheD
MSEARVHVKIGEVSVLSAEGILFAVGLGSCVAVALCDRGQKVCGLAHVMLPEGGNRSEDYTGRYAITAVPKLIEMMVAAGAQKPAIFARIVGGAAMFGALLPVSGAYLGERNVAAVKAALERASIPLHGEAVGGSYGRSVFLDAADGSLTIRTVQRADVVL